MNMDRVAGGEEDPQIAQIPQITRWFPGEIAPRRLGEHGVS